MGMATPTVRPRPGLAFRHAPWPHIASAAASTNQRAALVGGERGHWLERAENVL